MSKSKTPPAVMAPLPGKWRTAFTIILIPFQFLVLVEIGLRAFSYRGNPDLVITKTLGERQMLTVNPAIANRYFAGSGLATPEPQQTSFDLVKPANTKRIFCLGESTMQGFPYVFNATAPSFLRDRLQAELPQQQIEVIVVLECAYSG